MKAVKVMWINGQTQNGQGEAPAKLAMRKDDDGSYRWYCQGYAAAGRPSGDCTEDTEVSGATVSEAMDAAWASWGGSTWNLRATRTA